MKYFQLLILVSAFVFISFSAVKACEFKGELNKNVTFTLKKNQCHEFTLKKESVNYFQITVQQIGVDAELLLFENGTKIKSTDSENLNSGFEFLPFTAKPSADYILQIRWVDDRQTMIRNDGFYTLEFESRTITEQDKFFIEQFEKAKSFYDQATAERLNGNKYNAVNFYLSAVEVYQSLPQNKSVKYKLFLTNYYLGVSYNILQKYFEAVTVFEKIRPSVAENQDKYLENLVLKELGIAYFKIGNYQKSGEVLENAVQGFEQSISENIGEKQALSSAYINLADTFLKLNKIEQAITDLENIRADFRGITTEYILVSLKLADIYLDLGNQKKAEEIIVSLSISENLPDYIKGVFNKISGKLYMKSDMEKALGFFNKANS